MRVRVGSSGWVNMWQPEDPAASHTGWCQRSPGQQQHPRNESCMLIDNQLPANARSTCSLPIMWLHMCCTMFVHLTHFNVIWYIRPHLTIVAVHDVGFAKQRVPECRLELNKTHWKYTSWKILKENFGYAALGSQLTSIMIAGEVVVAGTLKICVKKLHSRSEHRRQPSNPCSQWMNRNSQMCFEDQCWSGEHQNICDAVQVSAKTKLLSTTGLNTPTLAFLCATIAGLRYGSWLKKPLWFIFCFLARSFLHDKGNTSSTCSHHDEHHIHTTLWHLKFGTLYDVASASSRQLFATAKHLPSTHPSARW